MDKPRDPVDVIFKGSDDEKCLGFTREEIGNVPQVREREYESGIYDTNRENQIDDENEIQASYDAEDWIKNLKETITSILPFSGQNPGPTTVLDIDRNELNIS